MKISFSGKFVGLRTEQTEYEGQKRTKRVADVLVIDSRGQSSVVKVAVIDSQTALDPLAPCVVDCDMSQWSNDKGKFGLNFRDALLVSA